MVAAGSRTEASTSEGPQPRPRWSLDNDLASRAIAFTSFGLLGLIPLFTISIGQLDGALNAATMALGRQATAVPIAMLLALLYWAAGGWKNGAWSGRSVTAAAKAGCVISGAGITYQLALVSNISAAEAIGVVGAFCTLGAVISDREAWRTRFSLDLMVVVSLALALLQLGGGIGLGASGFGPGHVWAAICGLVFSQLGSTLRGAQGLSLFSSFAIQMVAGTVFMIVMCEALVMIRFEDGFRLQYGRLIATPEMIGWNAVSGLFTTALPYLFVTYARQSKGLANSDIAIMASSAEPLVTTLVAIVYLGQAASPNTCFAVGAIIIITTAHAILAKRLSL